MKLIHVVGARPNFMKAAPVIAALDALPGMEQVLVHTGQHYDRNMSQVFFRQLGLPEPDINLEVGSASHAVQTARIMMAFETVLREQKPHWVVVYGDVNSTLAATLVATKMGVPCAHVEAGLRAGDRDMPEEINRLVTDQLADLLLTPSPDGDENLLREGISQSKIHFVGNVMIDTLVRLLPKAHSPLVEKLKGPYGLVTLHRPSNVDEPAMLASIVETLTQLSRDLPLVFPIHPRTRQRLKVLDDDILNNPRIHLLDPTGYLEFLALQKDATLVITDSGGIQEETTYLGVPCLTVRNNTERPVTLTQGTNILVGTDMAALQRESAKVLNGGGKKGSKPEKWDGRAGERIAAIFQQLPHSS